MCQQHAGRCMQRWAGSGRELPARSNIGASRAANTGTPATVPNLDTPNRAAASRARIGHSRAAAARPRGGAAGSLRRSGCVASEGRDHEAEVGPPGEADHQAEGRDRADGLANVRLRAGAALRPKHQAHCGRGAARRGGTLGEHGEPARLVRVSHGGRGAWRHAACFRHYHATVSTRWWFGLRRRLVRGARGGGWRWAHCSQCSRCRHRGPRRRGSARGHLAATRAAAAAAARAPPPRRERAAVSCGWGGGWGIGPGDS
eukprot:3532921-Prymnesium_polylepis.1